MGKRVGGGKGWLWVANPSYPEAQPPEIPEDAIRAAPAGVLRNWRAPILPREALTGPCRLCGEVRELTREHTPTKKTTYLGPSRRHELEEWLNREELDEIPGGEPTQGGIWGHTLCGPCNWFTGREYGGEYKKWVGGAWALVRQRLPASVGVGDQPNAFQAALAWLDQQVGWATFDVAFKKVDPGRFVRQILSMFCSVAGPWELSERHPELRRIVLDQEPRPLPPGLTLTTSLYVGRAIRVLGPTFAMTPPTEAWRWVCEIAYPPFAHHLVLASNTDEDPPGLDTGELTLYPPGQIIDLRGTLQVGFGHTPFPGDLRTRGQVESERAD